MNERKLATIEKIVDILPIEGADRICLYKVKGWGVVDTIGKYSIGDLVIYCEPDSWVPNSIAPFLSGKNEPREYEGIKGERLKSIRLRKTLSQGLILPMETPMKMEYDDYVNLQIGDDVTEALGIIKWEAPIPACLSGTMKGGFPSWGKKTDQERCQNLVTEIKEYYENGVEFEISIKLDGASMSVGHNNGEFVICSRNLSLELDQSNNTFVDVAKKLNILNCVNQFGNIMISGELCGPSIQKNPENLKTHEFFVFDVWDVDRQQYLPSEDRISITSSLGLQHVPIIHECITLKALGLSTVDHILKFAEGPSLNAKHREGVVFKSKCGTFSFKAISNKYLLSGS